MKESISGIWWLTATILHRDRRRPSTFQPYITVLRPGRRRQGLRFPPGFCHLAAVLSETAPLSRFFHSSSLFILICLFCVFSSDLVKTHFRFRKIYKKKMASLSVICSSEGSDPADSCPLSSLLIS